jgi:hypothetical protein
MHVHTHTYKICPFAGGNYVYVSWRVLKEKKSVLFQRFKTRHDLETISGALLADNLVLDCI